MTADLRYTSDQVDLWRTRICPRCGGNMAAGAINCKSCFHMGRPFLPVVWVDDALCRETDPEAFFPIGNESPAAAKAVCAECPVRDACLTYALDARLSHGIWGGTTPEERRRLLAAAARKRQRKAGAK